jgi:muconate cycloisomerase
MFKIEKIHAFAVRVPLRTPIQMAKETVHAADNLIVRATDSDGTVGWGEAASAPAMTGETPESLVAAARHMAAALEGSEITDTATLYQRLDRLMYGNHGAKAAIEIALLDLAGKRRGVPLYELLGGKVRDDACILTMIAGGDVAAEVESTKRQMEAGFTSFKVKAGIKGPERDLERATAVRAAAGTGAKISADANQGYDRDQAIEFARGAVQAGLDFMEQLVMADDLDGMAACARETSVPLGADEGLHSLRDIREHHERGAASGGSLKVIKLGGAEAVMEGGRLMDSLGMRINLAGKLAETSIASAAIAHLAVALPRLDWDTSVTNQYLADDVVSDPVEVVRGRVRPSDAPGLGITPSEDKLAKYTSIH